MNHEAYTSRQRAPVLSGNSLSVNCAFCFHKALRDQSYMRKYNEDFNVQCLHLIRLKLYSHFCLFKTHVILIILTFLLKFINRNKIELI